MSLGIDRLDQPMAVIIELSFVMAAKVKVKNLAEFNRALGMSPKELNIGARASRPHLDNTCGHAGGTAAFTEIAKWASYLSPPPQLNTLILTTQESYLRLPGGIDSADGFQE